MKKLIAIIVAAFTLSNSNAQMEKYHSDKLETVIDLGEYQAIGVAVSPKNRVFISFPKRGGKYDMGLAEIVHGKKVVFPDNSWNDNNLDEDHHFLNVQDLVVDGANNLWVLDSKPASKGSIAGLNAGGDTVGHFKMLKIDLNTNKVVAVYHFNGLDKSHSGLNDMRIDVDRQLAYLSDPGRAAIVVLDLKTDQARTVLAKSKYTTADTNIVLTYDGHQMRNQQGKPFVSNVNGIALTRDYKYFYFKPINCNDLYRIDTKYLSNAKLSDAELMSHVEDVGKVGITHGLVADAKGNIYLTTSTNYTISYISPDGKIHTLLQDSRLLWPDSLGIGTDGYVYFSCSQLQREATWNEGKDERVLPYRIYRVKLPK